MKENANKNTDADVIEIDFKRIWKAIWHKLWLICLTAVLGVVIALTGTMYLVTPQYKSSAMFYVNNSALSVGDASFSISSGDITASKSLVETYIVILNSRACLNQVIDYAELDYSYSELKGMISASAVNSTEIFQVSVTSADPDEAEKIANTIAYILPKKISGIVEGTSAKIVDYAVESSKPSSPNYIKNLLAGFVLGLVLSVGFVVFREIFDITIRTEEDIEQCCTYPVLAAVPDMVSGGKSGGYYSSYDNSTKRSKKKRIPGSSNDTPVIGKDISFAASEAYKLLRTKLQFSFADEMSCHVIGVSSAMAGEGKSLSSINLAYSLAQLDKRVLLIDCDMRRPSLALKLPIEKMPGLSNYLTGQIDIQTIIQDCGIDTEEGFKVIASGRNPPNPIELLSSAKMSKLLDELKQSYDYIILDLPPVGEVSDAMVAAKLADGVLLVARQDYCNTVAFGGAVKQFEFVESKILGVVMNCVAGYNGKYGKKYYKYKKYYSQYQSTNEAEYKTKEKAKKGQ